MKKNIHVDGLTDLRHLGLSQGVETDSFVFVASMALEPDAPRRAAAAKTVADETRLCLERLDVKLKSVGLSLKDVVKTTCYLTDRNYYAEFADAYKEYWDEDEYPIRCTVYVGLGVDCRVEIDAIAVKPSAGG
jgi:2-iminobutanoate/2-iminopropanoate deaminase